jgi:hypothetical protein
VVFNNLPEDFPPFAMPEGVRPEGDARDTHFQGNVYGIGMSHSSSLSSKVGVPLMAASGW